MPNHANDELQRAIFMAIGELKQNVACHRKSTPNYDKVCLAAELLCDEVSAKSEGVMDLPTIASFTFRLIRIQNMLPDDPERAVFYGPLVEYAHDIIHNCLLTDQKILQQNGCNLVDAAAMAAKQALAFERPDDVQLAKLGPNHRVEIGVQLPGGPVETERFWVTINAVQPGPVGSRAITGTVASSMRFGDRHDLELGVQIEFEDRHILQTLP